MLYPHGSCFNEDSANFAQVVVITHLAAMSCAASIGGLQPRWPYDGGALPIERGKFKHPCINRYLICT